MAIALADWRDTHVRQFRQLPPADISQRHFFRDPYRTIHLDCRYFLAPADGIIVYNRAVTDDSPLDVKGRPFTLQQIIGDDNFTQPCLVIGVFMTNYDVHINRVSQAGLLTRKKLAPVLTANLPMKIVEDGIFADDPAYARRGTDYLFANERMINRIYSPLLDLTYYIVQIADDDVHMICPFHPEPQRFYQQGDRFSIIRHGSQVDLVIPLDDDKYLLTSLVPDRHHVEGGRDKLVLIQRL
jgi:phosphatidylserine decarboxylase